MGQEGGQDLVDGRMRWVELVWWAGKVGGAYLVDISGGWSLVGGDSGHGLADGWGLVDVQGGEVG